MRALQLISLVVVGSMCWSRMANAAISMTPTPVDVGNVVVFQSGSNTGSLSSTVSSDVVDLSLTSTCSGTGTGTFSFTGSVTGLSLNTPKTITVNYQPTARGQRTCTVNVLTSGTATVVGTFQVRGTGVAPVGAVSPTSWDFGGVRASDTAVQSLGTKQFVVTNSTTDTGQTLTVSTITFSGANPGDFAVTAGPSLSATINPSNMGTWTVTFNPAALGARAATMSIATNDPIFPTKTVALTGAGTQATIAVTDIDFGPVAGGASMTLSTTVSSSATSDLGILTATNATITGGSWFTFAAGTGCTAGATSCTLTGINPPPNKTVAVRCSPPASASGQQTGTVTFNSDSDGVGDSIAAITCTVSRADVVVGPTALDFSSVASSRMSGVQTVMIANTGNIALGYSAALTGIQADQFTIAGGCSTGCTLGPGLAVAVMVRFKPTSGGAKSAALRVTPVNDPDTSQIDVVLTGTGL